MYASKTTVSVDKTIGDIRKVLEKAKSTGFAQAESGEVAQVMFKFENRLVKMYLHMPKRPLVMKDADKRKFEQARRSKWRALLLCIKAKCEAIESGIETFDEAFLPHIVLSNGDTVGNKLIPSIDQMSTTSPKLLLGFS